MVEVEKSFAVEESPLRGRLEIRWKRNESPGSIRGDQEVPLASKKRAFESRGPRREGHFFLIGSPKSKMQPLAHLSSREARARESERERERVNFFSTRAGVRAPRRLAPRLLETRTRAPGREGEEEKKGKERGRAERRFRSRKSSFLFDSRRAKNRKKKSGRERATGRKKERKTL